MGDVFKEQIVQRKQTAKDVAIRICLGILVVLIFFVSTAIGLAQFSVLVTAAAAFGAAYLMSFLKVEYEYIFTNGELDIDVIYNRSRRKRVFSANVKDFDIMSHVENKTHAGSFENFQDFRDYSSGEVTSSTYAFMINYNSKQTKILIEPNEKMLKAIGGTLSRSKLHMSE